MDGEDGDDDEEGGWTFGSSRVFKDIQRLLLLRLPGTWKIRRDLLSSTEVKSV